MLGGCSPPRAGASDNDAWGLLAGADGDAACGVLAVGAPKLSCLLRPPSRAQDSILPKGLLRPLLLCVALLLLLVLAPPAALLLLARATMRMQPCVCTAGNATDPAGHAMVLLLLRLWWVCWTAQQCMRDLARPAQQRKVVLVRYHVVPRMHDK